MRLYERCQNPSCPTEGGRALDEVRPPLRRDARYCSTTCGNQARQARREGVTDVNAALRFRQGMRALKTRGSDASRAMRDRHRIRS